MASFPYNSSSLLFQQLRNISSSAGEEANSPQHCSQAGHKWEQKPCKFWLPWIEGACVFIQVNSKYLAITNFPPQVNPSVNIQCQRVALTGWEYMKKKWIFRKSIMALYVPVTNDARSPSLLVNRTPLPQPVSTQHIWACFPLDTTALPDLQVLFFLFHPIWPQSYRNSYPTTLSLDPPQSLHWSYIWITNVSSTIRQKNLGCLQITSIPKAQRISLNIFGSTQSLEGYTHTDCFSSSLRPI